jgi:hypothetical protein
MKEVKSGREVGGGGIFLLSIFSGDVEGSSDTGWSAAQNTYR